MLIPVQYQQCINMIFQRRYIHIIFGCQWCCIIAACAIACISNCISLELATYNTSVSYRRRYHRTMQTHRLGRDRQKPSPYNLTHAWCSWGNRLTEARFIVCSVDMDCETGNSSDQTAASPMHSANIFRPVHSSYYTPTLGYVGEPAAFLRNGITAIRYCSQKRCRPLILSTIDR